MPEPTIFLSRSFPRVSIIRPTETLGAAAGAVKALTDAGLFIGQPQAFFDLLHELAVEADAARRSYRAKRSSSSQQANETLIFISAGE